MEIIESKEIKQKGYKEKLDNGLTVIIIPKENTNSKYVIWATKFGSIDDHFVVPDTEEEVVVPDGVAHFLEHKMFEQRSGVDALYTLMGYGALANAYTTNDHTAYLYQITDDINDSENKSSFYKCFDEFMDYVQNPYYTDENVAKEQGIIGQEIQMGNDDPGWTVYLNLMDCLYKNNTVKLDTAGTKETISRITKETLYNCYNTFYHPSNMVLVVVGDFEPNKMLEEIKKRLLNKKSQNDIKRIYPEEPKEINKDRAEAYMEISIPIFYIGFKDKIDNEDKLKRDLEVQIALNLILGNSSDLYQRLYKENLLLNEPDFDYEYNDSFAHAIIGGESKDPNRVLELFKEEIKIIKDKILDDKKVEEDIERIKKKIYGKYALEFDDPTDVGRLVVQNAIKGQNSFEYFKKIMEISKENIYNVFNELLRDDNLAISIVYPKDKGEQ